jgi:hypothetical protein
MKRLLLSAALGIALWPAIPSTSAQAAGHSCPNYIRPGKVHQVRSMRVGGTTCAGGKGVIANWAQDCPVHHCIVGAYDCHTRIISRRDNVSRFYCFAPGRFVIATFLGP